MGGAPRRPRIGLVLGGGGARGAYEAGVLAFLFQRLAREVPVHVDVVCGTSIGALTGCALAAYADDPAAGMRALCEGWRALSVEEVLRLDRRRVFAMIRALLGRPPRRASDDLRRGGLLDTAPLQALIARAAPFGRIPERLRAGDLSALAVSATDLVTGRATVFVDAAAPADAVRGPRTRMVATRIGAQHALASAAIPLLFPAVPLDGVLYCDGSLRHDVPLAPAIHLGCDAILIVVPRRREPDAAGGPVRRDFFVTPLFVLGKMLDALVLARVDEDLDRLRQLNAVIEAGVQTGGRRFTATLSRALGLAPGEPGPRPVAVLEISASEDIGGLAAAHVRSRAFRRSVRIARRMLARLGAGESPTEADLLSYMLFDGGFAAELVDLGWRDAERAASRLAAFFGAVGQEEPGPPRAAAPRRRGRP